ncbi:hypothetical protein [Micromonospora sp. CB01531]|uniref:hypothetical protein n=1 Tax=Micromonospora sp. CB01531 TaxID=1718947 RepID=UPI00096930CC|nr:hypothetical protein [Micromonospora sp. CB01531]OKI47252.1 hypothetical protein A6A27_10410 [Micromonospora sp. CB01531]
MVERPHTGPLPPVHPDPYGLPPQPDGQTVPHRPRRLPLATREVVYGCVIGAVVLVAAVGRIAGLW